MPKPRQARFQGTGSTGVASSPRSSTTPVSGPTSRGLLATVGGALVAGIVPLLTKLSLPAKLQDVLDLCAKEGKNAIYLPEIAVIIGRSASEWFRSGFMGMQERLVEETAAAGVWLWGVDVMRNLFDKFKPGLFRNTAHLSGDIAWTPPWGKAKDVDLLPMERFAKNSAEISQILKIKVPRWLFSVGLAIAAAAYAIPKLNQLKTNLILQYQKKKAQKQPPAALPQPVTLPRRSAISRPVPVTPFPKPQLPLTVPPIPASLSIPIPAHSLMPAPIPVSSQAWAPALTSAPLSPLPPLMPIAAAPSVPLAMAASGQYVSNTAPAQPAPLKFGFSGGVTVAQALGHLVEQTPYGNILAVDVGITGGRAGVARDPFEATEIVFRDALSLYFYIMFRPHMMKGMSIVTDRVLGTAITLEPKVADELTKAIARQVAEAALCDPDIRAGLLRGELSTTALRQLLQGLDRKELLDQTGWLRSALRSAEIGTLSMADPAAAQKGRGFLPLLQQEADVYLGRSSSTVVGDVEAYLRRQIATPLPGQPVEVSSAHLQKLLNSINHGKGAFQTLSEVDRTNLTLAVKHAFRHTVGVEIDIARPEQLGKLAELIDQLPEGERAGLEDRIRRMAQIDGLDQMNTMLRRSVNLVRGHLPQESANLMERAESLADWVDKAASSKQTLEELLADELAAAREQLQKTTLADDLKASLDSDITPDKLKRLEVALSASTERKASKSLKQIRALNHLLATTEPIGEKTLGVIARENITLTLQALCQEANLPEGTQGLVNRYQESVARLLDGKTGRLFSLLVDDGDKALNHKLKEMLMGGLQNDSTLILKCQELLGQFKPDSRLYASPGKTKDMRKAIENYVEKLLSHVEQDDVLQVGRQQAEELLAAAKRKGVNGTVVGNFLKDTALDTFYKLSRNTSYIAQIVAWVGTMVCLGWLVPKLQFALTKRLTGKDVNPGLASAESAHGVNTEKKGPGLSPVAPMAASALHRRNFQAFRSQA